MRLASGLRCLAQPVSPDVLGWGALPGHLLAWEEPGEGPAVPAVQQGENDCQAQQEEGKQWLRRVRAASLRLSRGPPGVCSLAWGALGWGEQAPEDRGWACLVLCWVGGAGCGRRERGLWLTRTGV